VLRIEDGEITSFQNNEYSDVWQGPTGGLGVFYTWMVENFPEDERAESFYYNYTDQANLDFWKQYIPLFLADSD
jgi:hypothetical protein